MTKNEKLYLNILLTKLEETRNPTFFSLYPVEYVLGLSYAIDRFNITFNAYDFCTKRKKALRKGKNPIILIKEGEL